MNFLKTKSGLEMQFAWLFAMIVGAVILFLTIFAVIRITQTENIAVDAATAKEIGVLLNPLETGFESAKTTSLILPKETRIYNNCTTEEHFGKQIIWLSQKSFNKWTETDIKVGFLNKYIFSERYAEGKKFFIFSKPFEFPFKVSDLIYITSSEKKYCFENPNDEISEELENLNQENIFIANCPDESIMVCFSGNCEIKVNLADKYVEKNNERMYFSDNSLMYAAIFSEPEIYECQLRRLMQRGENLALLYANKADIVSSQGCNTNLKNDLSGLSDRLNGVEISADLDPSLIRSVQDINDENEISNCRLW